MSSDEAERPDFEGPLFAGDAEEGNEFWVKTGEVLGEEKGETIEDYAKIRVTETRTIRSSDTETEGSQ